ncbi:uncharacterized protein LOC131949677 [Physella acuta]|uniref:uncharacterized protein LOC131949677 n=1 Tax=Physella acuta TaxID=109671 RepID=UPI0027DE102F|nr:uncharacterized protein LOC131949677 [Physella acuta]
MAIGDVKISSALIAALFLSLSLGYVHCQADCTMLVHKSQGIQVPDYANLEIGYNTQDDCFEFCRTKSDCLMAGFADEECHWDSVLHVLDNDPTYLSATKTCPSTTSTTSTTTTTPTTTSTTTTPTTTSTTTTPTTTSTTTTTTTTTTTSTTPTTTNEMTSASSTKAQASCSPSVFQDTDSDTASITLAISGSGDCHTACKLVQECSNYVYSSSTCSLYTSSSDVTSLAGSELGNKINCPDGSHCCFDTKSDTTVNAGTLLARLTLSQASCEQACAMLSNCRAVVLTGSACKVYLTDPVKVSRPGLVMSVKSCSQGSVTLRAECNNARSSLSYFNLLMAVVTAAFSVLVLQI